LLIAIILIHLARQRSTDIFTFIMIDIPRVRNGSLKSTYLDRVAVIVSGATAKSASCIKIKSTHPTVKTACDAEAITVL
jgi:hypothetical protein